MATQKFEPRRWSSAATAGLACAAGVLFVLAAQQRRLEQLRLRVTRVERTTGRDARLAEQQRLQAYLLDKALDDPDLAEVLSTVDEVDPPRRRQYLFANAMYTNALLAYRVGVVNWEELHGHLRVICQSAVFRDYWDATRHHRASLKEDSEEARVGQMMDALIHDLDEADTERWWVVGEPPAEPNP
ncbi:DUF6082 family protein [Streptomyces europaeiscabiei]|uniref:DUF6082 family protein n=1 Tax=Streptomyces europaeiscabiei TaxID=146819 RepID=UPI0029B8D455|nr:DUF6082 family protein [Streptomyces europaeiscabiei]MDX3611422.1 DUF6082 family protein [Streptomyces europaeiscabiei]MDX3629271.1 DUF6082 family protein [Streptomyces europaeiscabiei]MDX3647111.1 DUF6082 family protein [Streptomyces europaeiscabiei]WUD35925.1 DUF6082 family protein [Streptomyces europaeiscabiei]